MKRERLTDVEVTVLRETDKAWLVASYAGRAWIAKSLAELSDDGKTLTLPEWMAIDKGIV